MQTIQSKGQRKPPRITELATSALVGALLLSAPASALASAGLKPSEAPLVTVGQHYFGNTNNNGSSEGGPPDFWHLPPVLTGDAITIAWATDHNEVEGGPGFCLAQNVDDYSWAESQNVCNASEEYHVASNGSARTIVEAPSATSDAFLEFRGCGPDCEFGEYKGAYDFTIESIQHAIGVSLNQIFHIRRTGVITAHANLANGSLVPDGLTFYLNVRARGYRAQYQATSSGGNLNFPLALPTNVVGQTVALNVTRPADASYLRASSSSLRAKVARAKSRPHRRHRHRHKHPR